MTREENDALKTRIPVLDVLTKFGARTGHPGVRTAPWDQEISFYCPFCSDMDSQKPAGRANVTKNVWHCWSCGRGGSVIDAAMDHLVENGEPYSFNDAVKLLLTIWPGDDELLDPWAARDVQ